MSFFSNLSRKNHINRSSIYQINNNPRLIISPFLQPPLIMTIKFQLVSGEIFDFPYYGYSDFIDHLDPTKTFILKEKFTFQEFTEAHFNYLKFIRFKHFFRQYTRNILFKQLYDETLGLNLNNPVLIWLGIIPNKNEKEFIELINSSIVSTTNYNRFIIFIVVIIIVVSLCLLIYFLT